MLSAFKAQPIHELKQRDKSRIESLLAYGDRLLVGLNSGALRIYRVNEASQREEPIENGDTTPASPSKTKAVELMREEEKFSKKPVQQLAIVKEANLLVSLSDAYVSLHDLQTYRLIERLENTRSASCFTVTSNVFKDSETGVPTLVSRLAVGVKRKVLCWTWQDMEQLPDVSEISLEASIKSLTWVTGTRLIAGMDPGFAFVDLETEEIIPINKPASKASDTNTAEVASVRFGATSSSGMGYMGMGSWVPRPMAAALSDNEVLLAKDVNTLFTDTEGKALEKRQIPWALSPEAIGYSYPYLLALQPPEKGTLQIRNPDTLSLLQNIAVPGATILHVPQPNISLAHAGKGFLVASERTIWRMSALPYYTQLQELLKRQRFDEAISLLKLLEETLIDDKAGRIREIMIQKAVALFEERKYEPSLDLFTNAEAPPESVIKLYPKSIAGDLASEEDVTEQDHTQHATEDVDARPADHGPKEPPSTPSKSLFERVTGGHARRDSDAESVKSSAHAETDSPSPRKQPTSNSMESEKALEGKDLKLAVTCLTRCLAEARRKIKSYLNADGTLKLDPPAFDTEMGKSEFANLLPQSVFEAESKDIDWQNELLRTAQLVDTTLFRSYMLSSPTLAGSLFRIDNFCDPEIVQWSLYESRRYNDLIDFLHGKRLHRQALEMLMKFGKGEAEGEIPEGMIGPERTVAYLKQLPPDLIDMTLEFAAWPVREKPVVGMDVFLADTWNADHLPRDRVIGFLADIHSNLEVQYLEHIIDDLNDQTPDSHQKLVDLYLEELKSLDIGQDEKLHVKEKLESFLRKSSQSNKRKTIQELPSDDATFYESRAIVLSAMGNHKQALSIYVFQIKDYEKAEAYCSKIYQAEITEKQACLIDDNAMHEKPPLKRSTTEVSKDRPNIFATLLGLYLRPSPGEEKRWPQALDLLSRHGARLPASSTLDMMPDDLAVKELQNYFRGRLRNSTSLLRQEKVMRSLEKVTNDNSERLLLFGKDADADMGKPGGRNRRVRITEDAHCRVCHRRFGASAVRVYPDGVVVHYGCVNKRAQDGGVNGTVRNWG